MSKASDSTTRVCCDGLIKKSISHFCAFWIIVVFAVASSWPTISYLERSHSPFGSMGDFFGLCGLFLLQGLSYIAMAIQVFALMASLYSSEKE
jgi:hypothetical protein